MTLPARHATVKLASDVIDKLWRLWSAEEIRFVTFSTPGRIADSKAGRFGGDIQVSRPIEPSSDPTTYAQEAEQGKLAATSCSLVHEATHLVRPGASYPEEEVLYRSLL